MCCRCVVQVRLVLEYCDKGCLRTALDDGVFILGEYLLQGKKYLPQGRRLSVVCTKREVVQYFVHVLVEAAWCSLLSMRCSPSPSPPGAAPWLSFLT
jgi:hypothetical protein